MICLRSSSIKNQIYFANARSTKSSLSWPQYPSPSTMNQGAPNTLAAIAWSVCWSYAVWMLAVSADFSSDLPSSSERRGDACQRVVIGDIFFFGPGCRHDCAGQFQCRIGAMRQLRGDNQFRRQVARYREEFRLRVQRHGQEIRSSAATPAGDMPVAAARAWPAANRPRR